MAEDDLEPVDLEPVDLEPRDNASRFERRRDRRPAWIWVGLVGVGLAAWAAIALTTRGGHATPGPTTPTSEPHVDRLAVLTTRLRMALQSVGSGRFAAVIDDRLYVFDDTGPETLVALPEGHATITDQSGSNLLASTFQQTLVSTQPIGTRTLSPRDVAIRAVTPGRWWLLHDDGTLRLDHRSEFEREPKALRVVAEVQDGFVALDAPDFRWVLWSGANIRPLAPPGYQLVDTGPRTILFKHNCGYGGCDLEILDLARGTVRMTRSARVPEFAAFSPDGTRLALASTLGDVSIVDAKSGETIAQTRGRESPSPSRPFAWTPDSYALLVVQDHDIAILRASDGFMTRVIDRTDGLQQIAALP
jgi:hypothetical protein